jgi:hypothetical protein
MPRDHSLTPQSADALRADAQIESSDVVHARETARRECTTLIKRLLDARLDTRELIRSGV